MGFGAGKGKGRGGDTCGCSTPVFLVSCGGFVVVLIVAIVLLAVSVKSLDANEVGLAVDGEQRLRGSQTSALDRAVLKWTTERRAARTQQRPARRARRR